MSVNIVVLIVVSEQQIRAGLDVIVGTPGRTHDFAQKGTLNLGALDHVVLDEVDQMLDMGFSEIVEQILAFAYSEGEPLSKSQMFVPSKHSFTRITKTSVY